jgi:hypothetical protein
MPKLWILTKILSSSRGMFCRPGHVTTELAKTFRRVRRLPLRGHRHRHLLQQHQPRLPQRAFGCRLVTNRLEFPVDGPGPVASSYLSLMKKCLASIGFPNGGSKCPRHCSPMMRVASLVAEPYLLRQKARPFGQFSTNLTSVVHRDLTS